MEVRDVAGKNEFSGAGAAYVFMRGEKGTSNSSTTKPPIKNPGKKTN
jgi:hypothetical protein